MSDIQISSQDDAEDNVENMQTNWPICLIQAFKVKGPFKMVSRKIRQILNPLSSFIKHCHKICILSLPCSQLWVTKGGKNDDKRLKHF